MESLTYLSQLREILTPAQLILIALPEKLDLDKVAAGLSLYLALKKAGKQVSLVCSKPMTVEFSSLVGVDKVRNKTGGRNLIISLDYLEDSIEKVSYNIQNNKFNLVVQPKPGFPPLSAEKVKYSYSGGGADLIFVIGVGALTDLGEIFLTNKEMFKVAKLINFNIQGSPEKFALLDIIDQQASGFSELAALLISALELPLSADAGNNLLAGIRAASNNFSSSKLRAATFEAAAICLRAGAKFQTSNQLKPSIPSSDWLEPKIYKTNTLV